MVPTRRASILATLLAAAAFAAVATADDAMGCTGQPNQLPIYTARPVFAANHTYGRLYLTGPADLEPKLRVLHVYGTPYEMGLAYGTLLRDEVRHMVPEALEYIYSQIDKYIQFLPEEVRRAVEKLGVKVALELTYALTKPYIPQRFIDEATGLADGAGLDPDVIIELAMFPELIKAACSMMGAWGPAVADMEGSLVQLRALDWTTDGPFQKYPVVITYHPQEGNTFSILTWSGLVGAITGYSNSGMAISQKVWLNYKGRSSRIGVPFHFLLRDILQFDNDSDQALSRIASAHRTCSVFIGIGDANNNWFRAVEYSHEEVHIFNDKNYPPFGNHTNRAGLVYVDKHPQPSAHPCLPNLMNKYHGAISAELVIRNIVPVHQTGDMHIAVYDFKHKAMFVSNASPQDAQGNIVPAYDRQFIRLDMAALFSERL